MTPERFAIAGLLFVVLASILASAGVALQVTAVPLGFGIALGVLAAHEALVDRSIRK